MTPSRALSRSSLRAAGIVVARKMPSTSVVPVVNTTGGRVVTNVTKLRVVSQKARAAMRERAFLANLAAAGVPVPIPEHRFHSARKWRFDYAWPDVGLALEVDGGIWVQGRHSRGSGQVKEMEKFNAAAVDGWRILRVTPKALADPETAALVRRAIEVEP